LVKGLEDWRQGGDNRYLVTMFHELYAFGSIWTSQFWTSPFQRSLASRLVCLSDRCLTSQQGYAEIIQKLSRGKHQQVPTLAVFSNVGEPKNLTSLTERQRRLVVFGNCGSRSRVYQRSLSGLARTCRELEITEIVDIGPMLDFTIEPVNGISVTCRGIISAPEISQILSTSMVGFFDYYLECLAKSGIFAAYSAHRLLPVGIWYEAKDMDGLQRNKHYWLGDRYQQQMSLCSGQIIADNAYAWYNQHNLSLQARNLMNCLSNR
jgi:hypothetical protein